MTVIASPGRSHDAAAALASLGGRLASLIPAMMLGYMIVIWSLAFARPDFSAAELYMGWMAPMSVGADQPSPLKMIAYPILFILAVACALFTSAYRRLPLSHPGVVAAIALIALACASILWSEATRITFARSVVLVLIASTVLLSVYAADSFRLMMQGIFAVLLLAAVLNLMAVATQPPGILGHTGIHSQKNVFGWVSGLILFFGLYHLTFGGLVQRAAALFMVAVAPLLLIVSLSKTSLGLALLCPFAGLILLYAAKRMRLSPSLVTAVGVVVIALVYFIGQAAGAWTFYDVNETLLGDPTLTGRTDIWIFAAEMISRKPFLGYGYEGFWATGYEGIAYKNTLGFARVAPTGHNGYIDILVFLGIVGFALLVIFLLAVLSTAGRLARLDARLGWLSLTIAVFILLHNNLESDIFISSNPLSAVLMLFFAIGLRLLAQRPS